MIGIDDIIIGGLGLVGGLFDDSAENVAGINADAALAASKATRQLRYPGQKEIASDVSSWLMENKDVGLTEQEKQQYRGSARSSVSNTIKDLLTKTSSQYAQQGLRGGTVANALKDINMSKAGEFAKIESNIGALDIAAKQKRTDNILNFLNLKMGYPEEETNNQPVTDALNNLASQYQNLADNFGGYDVGGNAGITGGYEWDWTSQAWDYSGTPAGYGGLGWGADAGYAGIDYGGFDSGTGGFF